MPALDLLTPSALELNRAEMEFSWELYLEEMNAYPVPPEAFPHVRQIDMMTELSHLWIVSRCL